MYERRSHQNLRSHRRPREGAEAAPRDDVVPSLTGKGIAYQHAFHGLQGLVVWGEIVRVRKAVASHPAPVLDRKSDEFVNTHRRPCIPCRPPAGSDVGAMEHRKIT